MNAVPDHELWTAAFLNERFPAPVSPLGWDLVGSLVEQIALRDPLRYLGCRLFDAQPILKLYHGHPYVRVAVFQTLYKPFPAGLLPEDAARYFPDANAALRLAAPYPRGWWDPRMLTSLAVAFARDGLNVLPWGNHRLWARFERRQAADMAALTRETDALGDHPGPAVLLPLLARCHRADADLLRLHRWSLTHADLWYSTLRRALGPGGADAAAALTAGLPNRSLEVDGALAHLAESLAEGWDPATAVCRGDPVGRPPALEAFLSEHGHRSFSLDIWQPTFADDPNQALRLAESIGGRRRGDPRGRPPDRPPFQPPFPRRAAAGLLAPLARAYIPLRENQRYAWQRSLALQRRLYLLLGRCLAAAGSLSDAGDVFFLTAGEAASEAPGGAAEANQGGNLTSIAASRRRQHEQWTAEWQSSPAAHYPAFLQGDEPLPPATAGDGQAGHGQVCHGQVCHGQVCQGAHGFVLQGRPVSPGVGRGPARVLTSAVDLGRVRRGDVLVAVSTDPAWTPVFGLLAGLVLERGGQLSHGAVVAREYGLPAVAGVVGAVTLLNEGDVIEVDGGRGAVTCLQNAGESVH